MKVLEILLLCAFLIFGGTLFSPHALSSGSETPTPDTARMVQDIQRLSSREYSGRQAGTPGGHASGSYVAKRFRELGLKPAGVSNIGSLDESWGQIAPTVIRHILVPTRLHFTAHGQKGTIIPFSPVIGSGFLPVLDSPSVHLTAPLVFVGYGISDPARGWDEYEGLDIHDRVVMFLRGKPSHYPLHQHHTDKERTAREKGAIGFITLTGPVLSQYATRRGTGPQPLAFYSNLADERPLPGAWISGELGMDLLNSEGLSLQTIQENLNDRRVQSRELTVHVHMKWESTQRVGFLVNVLGMIPGTDPLLKQETVILGAHRDHFGEQAGLLFPGADDNASGTALLLEIARLLSKNTSPKRTILFASFSGEEQNLEGSTWFVQHRTTQWEKTVTMINVDHVGIGNGDLTVGVSNMSHGIAQQAAKITGLTDKVTLFGYFPGGDHVPFAKAGIPTIAVVNGGSHSHFHQASDTVDTVQTEPLQTAARFVLALTRQLANPEGPN